MSNKPRSVKNRPRGGKKNGNLVGGLTSAGVSLSRVSEGFMPLFPARTHKVLRYHDSVTLTSTAGAVNNYVFRANDLFDPNFTGTGHQPMGFDQMMVFYNHFAVDKCKIVVNFNNQAAGSFHAGIRLDASSTVLTNPDQIIEFGFTTYDTLEAKGSYGSSKTLEMAVDIAKAQGIPRKNITTDPNMRGDAATTPQELSYFHLYIWDPVNSASASVIADVVMELSAWFMEPRDATVSISKDEVKALHQNKPVLVEEQCVENTLLLTGNQPAGIVLSQTLMNQIFGRSCSEVKGLGL